MKIRRKKKQVTLLDCPPGLFLFNGSLGFKTEYGAGNPHNMEVYVVDSGECFWGGTHLANDRADLLVTPCQLFLGVCKLCNGDGYSRKSRLGEEPCGVCNGTGKASAATTESKESQ